MRISEKATIAGAPKLSGKGRRYLCIGPACWGKGKTAAQAIKNAKHEFASFVGPWKFILYDVQDDAKIDDMGSICYVPREGEKPYFEIARFEPKKK
jgi:hypothetical protein